MCSDDGMSRLREVRAESAVAMPGEGVPATGCARRSCYH